MAPGPGAERFLGRFEASSYPGAKLIFGINFVVFAVHIVHAMGRAGGFSALLTGGSPLEALLYGAFNARSLEMIMLEPWRLVSANWVHFGVLHFGMNMFAVVHLSRVMEPAIGTNRYLIAYIVPGVVGFAASVGWEAFLMTTGNATGPTPITAGASASLFGVLGVILGFLWRRGDPRWKQFAGQTVFYALIFGFLIRANNAAHIGGLVAGIPFGVFFAPGAPKPARTWQKIVAWGLLLLSVGSLAAARYSPLHAAALERLTQSAPEAHEQLTTQPEPSEPHNAAAASRDPEGPS